MAAETGTARRRGVGSSRWLYGAVAGLVGTIVFGLLHQVVLGDMVIQMVIPALHGIQGPALGIGWAFHPFHGVVIALGYVAIVEYSGLSPYAHRLGSSIGLGIGYGVLITIVLAVIVMPLWLSTVGFPRAPPFPNLTVPGTIMSLVGHTVYSLLVAVVYAALTR